nr:GNAT family N-acetyltransferase [Hyphomonas sp. Mor2]
MTELILPLTQSEAYERTLKALGLPVQRIASVGGTCLVQSRKLPVLGAVNLVSRGPVMSPDAHRRAFIRSVRAAVRGPLIINAPLEGAGVGLKIMQGAELAMIDLLAPDQMRARLHQKWRNQLKKGEKSSLAVIDQPLDGKRHAWFLDAEQAQQLTRKYRAHPTGFLLAFASANPGQARLYTAMLGQQPVAAMLVLKHGAMATYQAGVTTEAGRKQCAHNLLLWRIMCDLQKRGMRQLDLGRADLSTGLRRFKRGTGARIETLPGTFLSWRWSGWRSRQALPGTARA